jgi:hypothetical protein
MNKKIYILIGLMVILAAVALWAKNNQSNSTAENEVEVMQEE